MISVFRIASLFLFCGTVLFAAEPVFSAKTTVLSGKTIFKPGEKIPLKLICTCPDTHRVGAWEASAYLKGVPAGFEKNPKFKVKNAKEPKWAYVVTDQGRWFPERQRDLKEHTIVLDTKGWPEGDYEMGISITFQPKEKSGKFVYRNGRFVLTIEE